MTNERSFRRTFRRPQRPDTGFTLMEIMVALALVAILLRLAIPNYYASVNKSRRAECRSALTVALQNEERYFTNNNAYNTLTAIGSPVYSGSTASGSACTLTAYQGSVSSINTSGTWTSGSSTVVIVATPQNWTDSQCNASAYGIDNTSNFSPLTSALATVATANIPANCF